MPPYWRLAATYGLFFGTLGAFVPYWSVYLQQQGLGPEQIGMCLGLFMATRIVAPNLIAWWSYGTLRPRAWLLGITALTVLGFSVGIWRQDYPSLLLMMLGFGLGWHALLPQIESLTLGHLGSQRYGQIRLWGSLGFIVTVAGLGYLLGRWDSVQILPGLLLGLLLLLAFTLLSLPPAPLAPPDHRPIAAIGNVLRRPAVLGFLVAGFLAQASHAPYYAFYSVLLEQHGYGRAQIGQLWALGVVAEIGVFAAMHTLCGRYPLRSLFLLSLSLTTVRWLLIGTGVQWLGLLVLAQILHAASFGLYHATAMQFIEQHFQGHNRQTGQAVYNSLGFGAGGAVGNLASGYVWRYDPLMTYLAAAGLALLSLWVTWRWVDTGAPQQCADTLLPPERP